MADNPRIEELRRRVEKDPASIAFAQLAEEYRRAGNLKQAIQVCRTGLTRHPAYLSARVTLGRALLEHNEIDAAQTELDTVLRSAPENLAAVRGLAEIHHRRGDIQAALSHYRSALLLARHDPDLEQTIADLERELGKSKPTSRMSLEQVQAEFLGAFGGVPEPAAPVSAAAPVPPVSAADPVAPVSVAAPVPPVSAADPVAPVSVAAPFPPVSVAAPVTPASVAAPTTPMADSELPPPDPHVGALEQFLEAIVRYRASLPSSAARR